MPQFVNWCIGIIECDLGQDGIYRVPANQSVVQTLRYDVDRGKPQSEWQYNNDVHVVCGTLKVRLDQTRLD